MPEEAGLARKKAATNTATKVAAAAYTLFMLIVYHTSKARSFKATF